MCSCKLDLKNSRSVGSHGIPVLEFVIGRDQSYFQNVQIDIYRMTSFKCLTTLPNKCFNRRLLYSTTCWYASTRWWGRLIQVGSQQNISTNLHIQLRNIDDVSSLSNSQRLSASNLPKIRLTYSILLKLKVCFLSLPSLWNRQRRKITRKTLRQTWWRYFSKSQLPPSVTRFQLHQCIMYWLVTSRVIFLT
jgi:hypothetical protein